MRDFSGIWVPLVTPFSSGGVDHAALEHLVHGLRGDGVAGLVVCGTTGEAAALEDDEIDAVLATVMRAAGGTPVMVGIADTRSEKIVSRLRAWDALELAGALIPPPAYVRPSQAAIAAFYTSIAEQVSVPIVVYDVPYRTGVRIDTATLLALAGHARIQAVKDCAADPDHTQALVNDGRLQVLAGDDAAMFISMCQGAVGAIAASAHLCTAAFVAMQRALAGGDLLAARERWQALWPLTRALFSEPNPAVIKGVLAQRRRMSPALRAPLLQASEAAVLAALTLADRLDRSPRSIKQPGERREPAP